MYIIFFVGMVWGEKTRVREFSFFVGGEGKGRERKKNMQCCQSNQYYGKITVRASQPSQPQVRRRFGYLPPSYSRELLEAIGQIEKLLPMIPFHARIYTLPAAESPHPPKYFRTKRKIKISPNRPPPSDPGLWLHK